MGDNGDGRGKAMEETRTRHMDAEEIETYSLGGLSERDAASFDEHLLICDQCRTNVEASDAYVAAMRDAARQIRQTPSQAKPERDSGAKTGVAGRG
jgi:anti-sigma factor RsiW